jgi:hypothetical protein
MPLSGSYEVHGATVPVAVVGMDDHTVFVRVSSRLECVGLTIWPADAVVYFDDIELLVAEDGTAQTQPHGDRYGIELTSGSSVLLTAVALRKVPLGEVQAVAIEAVKDRLRLLAKRQVLESKNPEHSENVTELIERSADVYRNWALAERSNPRRKNQKDPLWYALLARDYVDLLQFSNTTERLAERHHLASGTIGGEIRKARTMGLLTKTIRGRRGGQLTPKAWALLETQTEGES